MNVKALHLYELMQTDIALCKRKQLDELKEIECCFHIAERYWAMLLYDLLQYEFKNKAEEIRFFKKIKPLFTSESEYYSLRYHAELFREESATADQRFFLRREMRRLERFTRENLDFCQRYKNDCTEKDDEWFVRTCREERAAASHDQLAATLLALERYHEFLKIELITADGNKKTGPENGYPGGEIRN